MVVNLNPIDNEKLVNLLATKPFASIPNSLKLVLYNADLRDVANALNFSQAPKYLIFNIISDLSSMGQDESGREALGRFLNTLIGGNFVSDKQEKQYIKNIIEKYDMMPSTSAIPPDIPLPKGPIIEEKDLFLESIIGENTLRPISFLLQAIEVSRCICYVGVPGGSGTGFLIGKNILITNNHVIYDEDILDQCNFKFNYQIGINGQLEQDKNYKAKRNDLFHTSPKEVLDYTIVELEDSPGTQWGFAKLNTTSPPQLKSRVNIIQHPGGQSKQISIQNNFLEYVDNKFLHYLTSTLPGSSGSPVFDDNWRVVALHRAGGMVSESQTGRSYFRNQGVRISAIIDDLPDNIRNILT